MNILHGKHVPVAGDSLVFDSTSFLPVSQPQEQQRQNRDRQFVAEEEMYNR
jgi:hypothetical protein